MITKKDIPLVLLNAIEGLAQTNLDIIKLSKIDNTYYNFTETDEESNNYFRIYIDGSKRVGNYDRSKFFFEWKPQNETSVGSYSFQGNVEDIVNQFEHWIAIIREINEVSSLHDDSFTKRYANFYFDEFKILDADADTSPFNPKQQDLIESYLGHLQNSIEKAENIIDKGIQTELLTEIIELKASLQRSTKNQVIRKITKIFGKLFRYSKDFAKETVKEAKKIFIKNLLENGGEYIETIGDMIS